MPAEHTTTATAPHKTTATPAQTSGSVRPTVSGRTTTTARGTRSIVPTLHTTTTTLTPTPTISSAPEAGGMSGAAIGGMAAGGAALVAVVGLLFYKRRKRSAVGDSSVAAASKKKGKTDTEAMAELGGEQSSPNKDISGPMSLAPEKGIDSEPSHRPEARFREQQQFRPGMREELLAQPGSPLYNTMSKSPASPITPGSPPAPVVRQNSDHSNQDNQGEQSNNTNTRPPFTSQNSHRGSESYLDNVNDYYGDDSASVVLEPMGAQRSAPPPRNLTQGNLTPTPVSHLATTTNTNKKNSDVDQRSMESSKKTTLEANGRPNSHRSSYSSEGGESAYLTLEQAQQAHNNKMMGHKESISSVNTLLEKSSPNGQYQYQNQGLGYNNNNLAPPPNHRGPGGSSSPISTPMSPDPYAESAFSDYPDDRSMGSAYPPASGGRSPYGNHSYQTHQPHYGYPQQGNQGEYYNGNGANKQQQQPVVNQRDSDYNQGPYGRF